MELDAFDPHYQEDRKVYEEFNYVINDLDYRGNNDKRVSITKIHVFLSDNISYSDRRRLYFCIFLVAKLI